MGYYNDLSLDYTGEDAFRDRMDNVAPVAPIARPATPVGPGPVELAVMGALERLADESAQAMRLGGDPGPGRRPALLYQANDRG